MNIMECPYCNHDLLRLEIYDNIDMSIECPKCQKSLILKYDEDCTEDFDECWDIWWWIKET